MRDLVKQRAYEAAYREKNREQVRAKNLRFSERHKEERKQYFVLKHKEYYEKNKEIVKEKVKLWRLNNKEKVDNMPSRTSAFLKEKRKQNKSFLVASNLRSRLNASIKRGKASSSVGELGCSIEEF